MRKTVCQKRKIFDTFVCRRVSHFCIIEFRRVKVIKEACFKLSWAITERIRYINLQFQQMFLKFRVVFEKYNVTLWLKELFIVSHTVFVVTNIHNFC